MAASVFLSEFYRRFGEADAPYRPFVAGLEQVFAAPRARFYGGGEFRLSLARRGWTCAGPEALSDAATAFALEGDGLADLKAQPPASVALIFMGLTRPIAAIGLVALGREAARILQPGGLLIVEAMNAEKRATAPDSLLFLAEYCGFAARRILYRRERAEIAADLSLAQALQACIEPAPAYALVAQKAGVVDLAGLFDAATHAALGGEAEAVRLFEGRIARLESRMQINLTEMLHREAEMQHRLDDAEWRIKKLRLHSSVLRPITAPMVAIGRLAGRGLDLFRGRGASREEKPAPTEDSWPQTPPPKSAAEPLEARLAIEPAPHPASEVGVAPMRLLILKLDHIGDLVMALPAMELLRNAWPKGHLTLVCAPENVALASRTGLFDEIIGFRVFPAYAADIDWTTTLPFASIRNEVGGAYDIAVDLRHEPDTRPYLAHVNAQYRAGFATRDENFCALDLALPNVEDPQTNDEPMHNVQRLCLLAAMVAQRFGPKALKSVKALAAAGELAPPFEAKTYVVLATGAGTTIKQWPLPKLLALTQRLIAELGLNVVLVGGEREKPLGQAIAAAAPDGRVIDLVGRLPLVELPALIASACAYVGNDTGVTHMAALLDTATVCVFGGANDSRIWRPVGPDVTLIAYPISCAPCRLVHLAECRQGHACMENIAVDEVLAPLRRFARIAAPPSPIELSRLQAVASLSHH